MRIIRYYVTDILGRSLTVIVSGRDGVECANRFRVELDRIHNKSRGELNFEERDAQATDLTDNAIILSEVFDPKLGDFRSDV